MGDDKPNPLTDAVKGLGLLLRAAKTVVERIPTKNLEATVVESAREVGRAVENVASAIEREVLGKRDPRAGRKPPEGPDGEGEDGGDRADKGGGG